MGVSHCKSFTSWIWSHHEDCTFGHCCETKDTWAGACAFRNAENILKSVMSTGIDYLHAWWDAVMSLTGLAWIAWGHGSLGPGLAIKKLDTYTAWKTLPLSCAAESRTYRSFRTVYCSNPCLPFEDHRWKLLWKFISLCYKSFRN